MEKTTSFVQAIAVKSDSHIETIRTVALSSAQTLAINLDILDTHNWKEWLETDYRKTVRKISKPSQINKLKKLDYAYHLQIKNTEVFVFYPTTYQEFPKDLSRLQVSGLDFEDKTIPTVSQQDKENDPTIYLNKDIITTTGKMAAQAAHILCQWVLHTPKDTIKKWKNVGKVNIEEISFKEHNIENDPKYLFIRDNGLTEIEKGTITTAIKI